MPGKTAAQRTEWFHEAKRGTFKAMAHFRRKLLAPGEMTQDDRQGAADLFLLLEEFLNDHVDWVPGMTQMTQRARERHDAS